MNAEIALKLARRFIELPQDKRPLFLDGLREEGVEFSLLPIPDGVVSEDRDELSYAQRRMWFLWQLDPQGAAYNLPMAVRLSGPLDRAAFEAAFASLVQRHETLRTVFPQRADGTPRQAALERPVPIDFEDLSLLPEAERETCLRETAQAESLRPFDLCEGPLLRVRLIRLGEEQHVLLLTLHHIVSDGWSMNVLIEEFSRFYKACMDNSEAGLPPLPIQYSDYALWQRSWMEAGEQERQLAYWRERLGDQHPLLELPTDHPRPAQASYRGTRYEFEIDPALVQALRASARSQGLTLFMLLLGGFNILLQRYSGQSDLRVGVPIANRNRAEVEGLIGLFVNTQVLRSVVEGQATVASLLASLKDSVLGAQAHQELPFERLVEAFKIERSLSHSPLFQVMYNHQPQVADIGSLDDVAGLRFAPLDWKSRTTQFDLSLDTYEKGGRLHAALTYATDLFEAETIERMARHWQNLLRAMLVAPAARIDTLPMLEADERRQMLETWNATAANYPLETCVHRLFEHQVQRSPEAPALVFGEQRLSYGELNRRANRLAHALIARGVGAESLIGVAMERSVELVIALMGILKAGGAYVPLDPEYPQERLSYMLEDSGVRLLLTQAHLLDGLPVSAEVQPLVLAADSERLEGFDASDPEVAVTGENLAYVIYTSGSTGRPKGAGNRHSALTNRLCWMQDAYQLDGSDAVMQKTPFSFDVSVWEFFWPLMVGARLVLAQPGDHRDPSRLMDLIGRESISTLHFVPSMLQAFLQAPGVSACTSLKRIVCSGEALPVDAQQRVLAELPGVRLYNLYGPTEAAIDVTHWDCREEGRDTVPIGRPIANLRCYVLDDALEPVPVGALGELYLAGAGLARGYHLRPALSAERFLADPFATGERMYRTGDLARYRADGVIEYAGRIDHQVKLRGLRIELGEIETRLLEHHAVREAAVLVVDGKQLVGYVTLAAEPDEWRGMLSAHLAESLPEYMVPMQWVALERMPLSPNGKLDRKALPRPDATLGQVVYSMPRSPAERCLAEIWEALLGIERVGLDDNFFALGGDSIVSIQMVGRARQAGFGLSPRDLFQHQTIRGLAQVAVPCDSAVIQAPVGGEVALTPVQHWFFGLDIPNRRHWNQSLLLKARESVDGERLEQALLALIRQHDALRLRFHEEEGCWRQEYSGEVESPLWRRQVASVEELSALCEEAQRSLDLSTGPLLRALLVELPEGEQRLLLVIHHLVVDGVSWRILLEDLQQFYQSSDSPAVLRTHSYQAWSAHLREVAGKRHDELAFWQTHLDGAPADLPCQNPHAPLENRHARKLALTLDAEATRRLLQEAPAAYRTQVIDLLLTALARVVCNWSGHESLLLQLEGHGREELGGELDLSRTVGWFTSLYPVHLHPAVEPGAAIKSVKEQLRSIPDRGIGYGLLRYLADPACGEVLARSPQPRITFNYLGQFDHQFADEALWVPAAERSGSAQDERAPLANWLSVEGQVYQGQLGLTWTFSPDMFSDETVQELVDAFAADLNGLIEHCCDPASGGVTPSDFPLAGLDQAQLDALSLPYGEIEDIYPLTPMQEGLLLHTLMEPNSGIYFMQDRYVIDSDIDMPRFEAAWREVARRHDALRASFHVDDSGQMRQIIHREAKLKVFFDDWSGRPEEEHEEALAELLAEDRRRGFDLLRTPPFFLRVIRRAPGRHWFVLSNHHILIDAWCRSLLLQDFFLLYSRKQVLPPAPRYRDFIEWLQTQGERAALEAWRKELEGFEQPTPLPFDRPVHRQGGTSIIGDRYANLAPEQGRRLRELAQQHHLTVNTLAQAAWALVLRRYSGLHDVLFGVTVAGRPVSRPEMQNTVGLFINSIALRVRLPGGDSRLTVREWLQGLFQQNLELREHEHLSLVQIQACSALEKGQRMFDSLFVYENAPVESKLFSSAEELQARSDTARTHTNYPLTVVVYPGDDLGLHLSYDERYFDEETVDRLLTDFKRLLLAIGDGFHDAFTELPLVPEEEYAALLPSPAGRRAYPFDEGYVRLFEAQVDRLGERVAATCRDRAWSYRQLDAEANRVAWGLLEAGVERDRAVALLADRGLELMAMMIGTFKAGAAYLPLDPSLPRSRLVNLLKLGGVPALVVGEGHQALARELLEELPEESRPALLDWAAQQGQGKCEQRPGIVAPTNGLAYVIYTSGSTGHPKGVMVEQAGMLNNQLSKVPLLALDENDVIAQTASQSFDISVWQFLAAPLFGAQVDILPNDIAHDPLALSRRVRERGITVLELVPSLIQEVLDDPQETLPGLRWMLSTGEALSPELARRWLTRYPQVGLMNAYGPAECSDDVSFFRVDTQSTGGTYLPIGQATDNNHLQVLDDDLLPVPLGGIGELYVSGTGVGRGYLADPGRTALAFLPDPYAQVPGSRIYRTGDLACRGKGDQLEYVGRIDHQVKVRGFRIELGEIESRLLELPIVREAVVLAQDGPTGKSLAAYLVPAESDTPLVALRDECRAALKGQLPEYMLPSLWRSLDSLPLNPNGKIDRKALPPIEDSQDQSHFVAPHEGLERSLAEIWAEVLKVERVGRDDNFFELGGHSLLVTQVLSRIRRRLGLELPLAALFEHANLADFAAYAKSAGGTLQTPLRRMDRGAASPLSYAQQRQWFLWQLEPDSAAYHIPAALRLCGELDVEALKRSFAALVERHEGLRTTFRQEGGETLQVVHDRLPLEIREQSLGVADEAALMARIEEEVRVPFDLERGPLLRVLLLRLSAEEQVLVVTLHHIVSDGWSTPIMVEELMQFYAGYREGRAVELEPLPIQYADYALWQRSWMEAGERERQLAYWRQQLGGEQPVLELPTDRPRPSVQSPAGDSLQVELGEDLGRSLKQLAQQQGVTLFMLLLASFQTLLHRYSGQPEIRVGVPIANRTRVETERLIGFFVNTQVLKANFNLETRFDVLLQQVKRTALEAQAHQDLPFEQLVEALQPQRSLSHSPLFQVMYNHQNAGQGKALKLPGLRVEALERASATAQFDLTLDTYESGDALSASLIYATSLFERSTVERLAAHWRNLLEAICREPARRVGELPLLDRSERDLLLARRDQTGEDYPSRPFVHQLVAEQARRAPEAIAVLFGEQRLSYGELDSQANRLAQRLVELGVGPEVRVAIAMRRSAEIMVAFLAVLKAGGAYVPLDIAYPAERLRYMLEDCGAALVLTQRDVLERLPLPAGLASLAVDDPGEWQDRPEGAPEVDLAEENLAYVIYTSGSTGLPKGVAVSHGPLVSHIRATGERYETSPADCELHFMSFAFDGAHEGWMHPLINGARVLVRDDSIWLPEETYAQMHRHGVTIGVFPPVYLQQLAEHAERDGNPPPVRVYCFGGDAVPQASYELAWESLRPDYLFNGYGPTETVVTPLLWKARPQDPCGAAYAPIGTLLGRRRAYVLGADLDLLPLGLAGELYLGGEGVARGYLDRPALTAERFVPDPYGNGERVYRSGDLTRARADGLVDYLGRVDHQVKIRGFRIELGEIEARLLEQECVREAVVLARDGANGKQLVGYVVPQDVGALEGEKRGALREVLKSALKASLPEYMVPTQWVFLAALPLTPNGKLDRKALPAPDASDSQQQYVAPATELERTLAAIWADVLKLERVGMADNFFELGGDSIISLQLVSRARQAGIRFTPKDLFQYQTIQGLAGAVRFDTGQLVDQGPVLGSMPLMPIQQRFFEEDVPERHHWNQSLLLEPSEALDPQALQGALAALVEQHDALRLRYMPGERGWQAEFLPQEASEELLWERTLDATEELEEVIEACQRSLDLRHGPLLRALLAALPDGSQRLLLVVHHLVVDGVSWRILLEDLQQAYQALATGEMPHLPAKTSSFKVWAERVQEHARGPALKSELAYWQAQLQGLSDNLPCDNPHGRRQLKHAAYVGGRLEREWTRRLLQQAPAAYRTQINDLLLTALARVVCRWSGEAEVLVRLEGHGREDLFEDIDLSRTVGWFTSLYPLRLSPRIDLVDSIKTIKEQIRAVPNKGIGYGLLRYLGDDEARTTLGCLPEGQLVFNYLGQFDGSFDQEQGLFVPAREGSGAERSDEAVLDGLLALSGQVYDGELSLQWTFSREVFEEATIQRLADEYLSELQALVAHCCEERNRGLTPSDFPLADIDQARLDSLPLPVGSIADLYPLSPMQQGMLFHSLYEEGAGDYINQMQVEVEGLDVARFRLAWEATLEAHDVLRSGFVWEGELGRPLQVVHKSVSLPFAEHDWRGRTDLESALEDLADQERLRTFDLQQAPLLRWVSVRVADHRHRLIYTNHHILMDGWSGSLLLGEVLERYSGRQPAPQAGRYRDYIAWLQRQDRESAERYWKERLAELDAPTRLAQAIRCELLPASGHGHFVHAFDPVSTQHFEAFARTQRVTLNTLVQSAWLLLLQRYTGQDTVCFGATVAGRPMELPGIEQQVGLFINTLPVIASPRADLSVVDWISQVQDCNLGLREYEHTPLYEVQRWAGQGGEGLFDSLLVFENYPVSEALEQGAPSGLRFGEVENREQTNYPLTLSVGLGETLQVQYSYDRRYLDSETVERLASHWRNLLEAMCRAPEIRLGELRMLDEDERQRYLALGCDMDAEYPRGLCLHTLFEAQAGRFADAPAVLFDGELLTYGELNRRANRLAHYLLAEGVGTESLVGIAMERGPDMLVGLLAVLKAGAAYVPLDPDYPRERLAYMLEDSGVRLVLSQSWLSPGLPLAKGVAALDLDRTGWLDGYPSNDPLRPLAAENLAYVIYTSGSTGRPKGVQIEHRSLLNFLASMAREPGCTSSDRLLQLTSLSFDIAGLELYLGLTRGACIVMPKAQQSKDPQALLALIEEAEVSIIQATPATWRMLLDGAPERAEVLRGRKALCGGEALGGGLARRLLAHVDSLWNVYGPTETTIWSSCQRVLDSEVIHLGGPIGNTALHVLDDELEPMPAGGGGELLIGGDGLARGYFARPALTAERFVPNPFDAHGGRLYRTGDLASRRSDGVIDYLGRVDHQVKIRGFRIELGEIEARLQEQGLVREAVVLAQEGAHGAQLVGYVVPITSELAPDWRDVLRNALKGCLPEYMVPAQLVALERLPLTPNGKIDRKALPKPDAGAQTQAYAPPQTEAEKDLARLWREVLGVERVGLHDNFFELGGDSILAVQLVGRIRLWRAPGLEISLRDLMHKPTIAALLESRSHAGSPLVSLNRGLEQVPPLFCIHGIFGTAFDYLPLARRMEGRRTVIGIQSPLLSGYRPEGLAMRELARQYAGLIRQRQPQGPYSLMGWSLGAVISLFVARELEKQGEEVVFLGLADAPLVDGRGRSDQELGQVLDEFLEIFLGTRSRLPAEASVDASVVASHIRAQVAEKPVRHGLTADELIGVFETVATLRKLCWDAAELAGLVAGAHCWWVEGREAEARQFQAQMSFTLARETFCQAEHDTIMQDERLLQELDEASERSLKQRT